MCQKMALLFRMLLQIACNNLQGLSSTYILLGETFLELDLGLQNVIESFIQAF